MYKGEEYLCEKFAEIIGGQAGFAGGKCVATITRDEIRATILGRRFIVTTSFSYESLNHHTGRALCLGRAALLEEEVDNFTLVLREEGITVSAIHHEWLFDKPHLIYVNLEAVEEPIVFAKKVRRALRAIRNNG